MIDANAYLGEWPFRKLRYTTPETLLRKMDAEGIEQTLVSSLENVFYKDLLAGNRLHAHRLRGHTDRLTPVFTVNPAFPGWEEDLEIAIEELELRIVRMHPNYHAYQLTGPHGLALLEAAKVRGLTVVITVGIEDTRHHHWLTKVPNVPAAEIADAVSRFPDVPVLVAGGAMGEAMAVWERSKARENLYLENSRVQGPMGDLDRMCATMGADHVLLGTNLPLHYAEAALMALQHARISDTERELIAGGNARRLFGL